MKMVIIIIIIKFNIAKLFSINDTTLSFIFSGYSCFLSYNLPA